MILADSNVLIDARDKGSPFRHWAEELIADALSGEGISVNAIVLAEICVGQREPATVQAGLLGQGFNVVDLPASAALVSAAAYTLYRSARRRSRGGDAPRIPLPDFFIGAHAELMGWKLATRDSERFRLYFPKVRLIEP